ncbi:MULTISPECIES: MFS transporter [unclassified Herbaspirillum]|uniref:MFS transporter n=1 Tax=unclassified Herbaspirillum TaxID=2624150 RepID=UPI00115477BE|nr:MULTISPECIES: MFS transporter [unclassified Herbaspirillum]MBB5391192.1 sugar phosphate permease [Herbaspirillum sp. SJZ102]TQK13117.1 sugar phosphate permease [Herbaspirillum sp. SJZ130]TQK15121.1 sugar phosphate permease [Herbaspirillum sp. SJZ106]
METTVTDEKQLERETVKKVTWRLLPFLMLCYLFAFIDRGNIGMAALQMNQDIGLSSRMFGFAGSLFFIAYFIFEVPSNLALQRFGARKWLARIMITWGLISACTALVQGPYSLYFVRFILGAAEAGFFPGVVLYLTYWIPSAYRARIVALFMVAIPAASFIASPLSALLLQMDGIGGMRGWHWLFIIEGLPTVLLGIVCLFFLTDRPEQAAWLTARQREWLARTMVAEAAERTAKAHVPLWKLFSNPHVWGMALVCSCASAAGSVLNVWQPQLLKSFGLNVMQIGLINSIPYAVACVLMVWWGRHSDRTRERRWHTAIPLLLIGAGMGLASIVHSLAPVVILLSLVLIGAYSFKGPFWAMATGWLATGSAAAGLAGINAVSNLIGGGLMVNVYGWVKDATGSYSLALLPLVLMSLVSVTILLVLSRKPRAPVAALKEAIR